MGQNFEFYFFLEPDISFSVQWKRKKTKTNTEKEQMMRER